MIGRGGEGGVSFFISFDVWHSASCASLNEASALNGMFPVEEYPCPARVSDSRAELAFFSAPSPDLPIPGSHRFNQVPSYRGSEYLGGPALEKWLRHAAC